MRNRPTNSRTASTLKMRHPTGKGYILIMLHVKFQVHIAYS